MSYAILSTPNTQRWTARAACVGYDPELWFADDASTQGREDFRDAQEICASCPVSTECLDYARKNRITDGIWGGKSREKASKKQIPRKPATVTDNCGTPIGYRSHYRRGETSCPACRQAHNDERRDRRLRQKSIP